MNSSAKKVYRLLSAILVGSILFSVLIFIGGWVYVFKYSAELGKARTESQYMTKQVEALDDLNTKYKKVESNQPLALESIPTTKELSSFMAGMEGLANQYGLKIKESSIGTSTKSKVSDWDLSQMVKKDGYYILPIKFNIEGSYAGVTNYLSAIYTLRRVTGISDINIIKTNKAMADRRDEVRADFIASIYVKK